LIRREAEKREEALGRRDASQSQQPHDVRKDSGTGFITVLLGSTLIKYWNNPQRSACPNDVVALYELLGAV
jgi:hypothetical protein